MRATEQGFLLLTSPLGDPQRKPLTAAQFRTLANRVRAMEEPKEQRDLTLDDLSSLGYDRAMAYRILHLLSQEDLLEHYLRRCRRADCVPVTRLSDGYPAVLWDRLGTDCPPSLWAKGDLTLLQRPAVALVGSREIGPENRSFAWEVGTQAAAQGYVLVSGNARGADRMAQTACRRAGGQTVLIVADSLENKPLEEGVLYLSEDGFDLPFSAQRALSRNRLIHALGERTFVAQCTAGSGGTWDGTVKNLQRGLSSVYCYADGSQAVEQLTQMGAAAIGLSQLQDIGSLPVAGGCLFDQ